jgi:hypothetical protein
MKACGLLIIGDFVSWRGKAGKRANQVLLLVSPLFAYNHGHERGLDFPLAGLSFNNLSGQESP